MIYIWRPCTVRDVCVSEMNQKWVRSSHKRDYKLDVPCLMEMLLDLSPRLLTLSRDGVATDVISVVRCQTSDTQLRFVVISVPPEMFTLF